MSRLTMTDAEIDEIRRLSSSSYDCYVRSEEGDTTEEFCNVVCEEFGNNCPFKRMADKLKEYEDLEEYGLLLKADYGQELMSKIHFGQKLISEHKVIISVKKETE